MMASEYVEEDLGKVLSKLKYSRRGKKASVTKRTQHLQRLVDEGGSRRIMTTLLEGLRVVYTELEQVCYQISCLSEELDENNCLELIRVDVETCVATVEEHLEDRKNEPTSSASISSSWVRDCSARMFNDDEDVESEERRSESQLSYAGLPESLDGSDVVIETTSNTSKSGNAKYFDFKLEQGGEFATNSDLLTGHETEFSNMITNRDGRSCDEKIHKEKMNHTFFYTPYTGL